MHYSHVHFVHDGNLFCLQNACSTRSNLFVCKTVQVSRVFEHWDPLKCASLFPSCNLKQCTCTCTVHVHVRGGTIIGPKVVPDNVRIRARLARSIAAFPAVFSYCCYFKLLKFMYFFNNLHSLFVM